MPPAPRGARISYGPSLSPGDSGIGGVQLSLADQERDRERMTAYPEVIVPVPGRESRSETLDSPALIPPVKHRSRQSASVEWTASLARAAAAPRGALRRVIGSALAASVTICCARRSGGGCAKIMLTSAACLQRLF